MSYKIAVYPGTFDPITNGHLDIIKRASKIFDKLIIGISENNSKNPIFTHEIRLKMIKEVLVEENLNEVDVKIFKGLLVDFAKHEKAKIIVRGLRAVSDFEYEFQMACVNNRLDYNLETVFLPANDDMHFISSRFVKSIAELKADISKFVPQTVIKYFK